MKERSDLMISHGGNYTHWTEELKIPLEKFVRENEIEWGLFLVSLGARWGTEIFVRTNDVSCDTAQKYSAIMRKMTLGELLAMFYAVGSACFNQGPISTLERLFVEVNPGRLFTMLVLARRLVKNVVELLALVTGKDMEEAFVLALDREDLVYNWIYSALVDTSGLLEGPKETDWDAPGFFFPHQIAAITNTEIRDLVAAVGPVLVPIHGFFPVLRYPEIPVSHAAQQRRTSLLSLVRNVEPRSLTERVQWEMGPPMAFTILKNVAMLAYNLHVLQRERTRKDTFISVQNGTVEYVHGPVTPSGNAYRMPWQKQDRVKTLKAIYVLLERDPNTIQPQIRLGVKTQLSQHPFVNSIPHYRMHECLRYKIRFGGALPKGQSMDVTLTPFDSTLYREQQERAEKELRKKPCTGASFPESRVLNIKGKKFDLLTKFPRSLLDLPSEIISLLVERYGMEQVQKVVRWCHPGGKLAMEKGTSSSLDLETQVEAISDTELGESTSGSPMDVEAGP